MSEYIITDEQVAENRRLHGKKLLVMPVIVRCRDCKYFNAPYECHRYRNFSRVHENGFCAWSCRRSDKE